MENGEKLEEELKHLDTLLLWLRLAGCHKSKSLVEIKPEEYKALVDIQNRLKGE